MSPYNHKQVIYLITSPLTERDFKRFGIQNWVDHGWKVKVFDGTSFLRPKFWRYVEGDKFSANFEGLKIFNNIKALLSALHNLQNKVVFIDLMALSVAEMRIRKIASVHGVLVGVQVGFIPGPKNKINIFIIKKEKVFNGSKSLLDR